MIFRNRESQLKKQASLPRKEADSFSQVPQFSEHPIHDHPDDPHVSEKIIISFQQLRSGRRQWPVRRR